MSHHPNCPNYRLTRPCAPECRLIQPRQYSATTVYIPQTPPQIFPPTYATAQGAIQSTRLMKQDFDRATDYVKRISSSLDRPSRHVHFEPPLSRRQHASSRTDGVFESAERPQVRTRRHTASLPTSRARIPRSILRPEALPVTQPTIYIVTFATDHRPNRPSNVQRLLETQIPHRDPPIPHLHTIDARPFTPPSPALCLQYSGISPVIQDIVLSDRHARNAVKHAISDLLACGQTGIREVCMSVCCHAGTHRSVAIGERIAQGVKAEVAKLEGCGEGVRIVVRHVSRVKGRGDPV
jgi:hypothetical protein